MELEKTYLLADGVSIVLAWSVLLMENLDANTNEQLGQTAGVRMRRVVLNKMPYIEIMVGETLLRLDPQAAMVLCEGLFEACTNQSLKKVQLRAMMNDSKPSSN